MLGLGTEIKILKAGHGDCILIKTHDDQGDKYNILIDGGAPGTFRYYLKRELKELDTIHLLVLTHIDSDHISGLIDFFKNSEFGNIQIEYFWINGANLARVQNGGKISYSQGVTLEKLIISKGIDSDRITTFVTDEMYASCPKGISLDILSPPKYILKELYTNWPEHYLKLEKVARPVNISSTVSSQIIKGDLKDLSLRPFKPQKSLKEDIFNSSSIAFFLNTGNIKILLLADSRSEIIVDGLKKRGFSIENKLEVDYIKVSHHGSKNNTSNELLSLIKCNKFIFSTNGGNGRSEHPSREVISRILYHPERDIGLCIYLYFNYSIKNIVSKCDLIFTDDEILEANCVIIDDTNTIYIKSEI